MKPYIKQDILGIYRDLILSAHKNYTKHRIKSVIKDIASAARWMYDFNYIYSDVETEELIKSISDKYVKKVEIILPKENHCLLIDSFLWDNRGLSQQYLRAMMANDLHIMIISTNSRKNVGKGILSELENYDKVVFLFFEENIDLITQCNHIVNKVEAFAPKNLFLHISPWDVAALLMCHSIKGPTKFNINLTDHAFWLGASFIDYNLEFRPYGMTVSLEKRGLEKEQILPMPYYPITPLSLDFEGFPDMPSNAIKVFTGGALYKMLGKNDIFFHIMECILNISPVVYILVAGFNKDKRFDEKISKVSGKERVLQIGVRQDIDSVFEHCDIYLSTYPKIGGLMSQYAAKHGKPVIAYHENNDMMNVVEEILNHYQNEFKSFVDLDSLVLYAEKLIKDKTFRRDQGRLLQDGMMNFERFDKEFINAVSYKTTSIKWNKDAIDYDLVSEDYLNLENQNGFMATRNLVNNLKFLSLVKIRESKTNIIEECRHKVVMKIKSYFI